MSIIRLAVASVFAVLAAAHPAAADGTISNASGEATFSYGIASHTGETGVAVATGDYEYGPSAIKVSDNEIRMWYCGGGDGHGDGIYYVRSTDYGQTWSERVEVIRASRYQPAYLDYTHACDPSVVMADGYYFIAYTGAPDWGPDTCGQGRRGDCDNRIFLARVAVGQQGSRDAYQKLVNVGECVSSSCFQWQPFWQNNDLYPPVPVVRDEIGSVWRRIGTGSTGYTGQQTTAYGIGQPSMFNVGHARIFFTRVRSTTDASVAVWQRPAADFTNAFLMQDYSSYYRRVSNRANDVNYDLAYDGATSRYAVTIGVQLQDRRPMVHYAHRQGFDVTLPSTGVDPENPDDSNYHIISRNLRDQTTNDLTKAEGDAHNTGFLRDQYGNLTTMKGSSGGYPYYWVYYGSAFSQHPSNWNINRIPFTRS